PRSRQTNCRRNRRRQRRATPQRHRLAEEKTGSYGVLLAAANGEKVTFVAAVSDDLVAAGLKAGDWVRETAKVAGGGGGGRPQMAQAGGKDSSKLQDALTKACQFANDIFR